MCSALEVCEFFLKIFQWWEVSVINDIGLSGGLLAIWNLLVANLKHFHVVIDFLLIGKLKGFAQEFNILNNYGPYIDR